MPDWSSIDRHLNEAGVRIGDSAARVPVGGGDISAAWRLQGVDREVFLKTGRAASLPMFTGEAEGLSEIAKINAIRVPEVLAVGCGDETAFLAIEWLPFEQASRDVERRLGERLAALHRATADRFGWHRDNTIGLTPQHNTWSEVWVSFFNEHRLGYQLELAAKNGYSGELQAQGRRLRKRLPSFFDDYEPLPSLLHGDLWGGNWASSGGEPVIFDPAVYYGDRETDLAMTRLFGGFGKAFYEGYEDVWPLHTGSRERLALYQLYHVLNHLNLFGSGYLARALELTSTLL